MITFDSTGRPLFTPRRVVRPVSEKQIHVMSEYRSDCEFTEEDLKWFSKFKDKDITEL